jgi:hypothetical protein
VPVGFGGGGGVLISGVVGALMGRDVLESAEPGATTDDGDDDDDNDDDGQLTPLPLPRLCSSRSHARSPTSTHHVIATPSIPRDD